MNDRKPSAAAHSSVEIASSMFSRKIWGNPQRCAGYSSHQSLSQRLWASMPARRRRYSSASFGGYAISMPVG